MLRTVSSGIVSRASNSPLKMYYPMKKEARDSTLVLMAKDDHLEVSPCETGQLGWVKVGQHPWLNSRRKMLLLRIQALDGQVKTYMRAVYVQYHELSLLHPATLMHAAGRAAKWHTQLLNASSARPSSMAHGISADGSPRERFGCRLNR
jgi:hypothetical protein